MTPPASPFRRFLRELHRRRVPQTTAFYLDAAHLEGGMVDLLAAKRTGEGGLRAAEPRAVLAAWSTGAG